MSNPGEREDAPEVEVEDGPEVEAEVEETTEESGEEEGAEEAEESPEAEEGGGEEAPALAAKPRSAATIAVQTAKREKKEAAERAERAEARLAEIERERAGRLTAEQQAVEQERVRLMSPDERVDYEVGKVRQETRTQLGAIEFRMQDAADRSGFESLCARSPAFDAVREEVETTLRTMRNNGGNSTRETVATYLIGKRAIERAQKGGKSKQSAAGQKRVLSQRVAAPAGRSDVTRTGQKSGGDTAAARAARLADQQI